MGEDKKGWGMSLEREFQLQQEVKSLRQQLAEAQADAIEQARIVGMGGEREIDLRQHVALLRDALEEVTALARNLLSDAEKQVVEEYTEAPKVFKICDAALAATEPITNTRRRNADDMGNPPANAAELLNARKPKP